MSLARSLVMIGVLALLASAVQAQQQSRMVLIPVCSVEVTWERLETENVAVSRQHDSLYWSMAAVHASEGDDFKTIPVSMLGPIRDDAVPTTSTPWIPKRSAILLLESFTRQLDLRIYSRAWRHRRGGIAVEPGEMYTILCPPAQDEILGMITQGQRPSEVYIYTYKMTIKVVGTKSIPALLPSEE